MSARYSDFGRYRCTDRCMNVPPDSTQPTAAPIDEAERIRLALDAGAIVGTWVWDIPNDRISADERFAHTFGLPVEQCAKGLSFKEISTPVHPDDIETLKAAVSEAMGRGGPYRCEYRVLQSDGVYRWVEASGRVELNAEGQPIRFPGVLLDIEQRRSAEAERDRVASLLRTFTAAVPGVVYAKDLDGRMLVANQGTTQLIGKPPSFYIGKTDLEFLEDKDQALHVMETDQRIMRGAKAEQIEELVSMPDGSATVWLSLKAPLLDDSGTVIGLIGSSIDVTARKNAEEELQELNRTLEERVAQAIAEREAAEAAMRQSQKMEAVGQLTGGIAHDFNNLLAGISGSIELMKLRLAQGKVDDIERYLSIAQGATQRAAALTHRLLAFARRQTLAPVPTRVNELIKGMEQLLCHSVGPSVEIKLRLAADLWPSLLDPAQVENALLNLCINSRDAMPNGGCILIETFNTYLGPGAELDSDLCPGEYLVISVSDTGIGMSTDVLARAFEPFFSTKAIGNGSGLGLSMIYGFVQQSGGQVRLSSQAGVGTTVCLYLPHHSVESDTQVDDTPPVVDSGRATPGKTVLVVEDESSIRVLVVELLAGLGYEVLEASDSNTGLLLLNSNAPIDLLVTDVGLPGTVNGRQMADLGRQFRPGLPVLFMTGYAQSHVLENCHMQPSTGVLTKPFALDALLAHVNALVNLR